MKQVLWERGLWKDGMIGTINPETYPKGGGLELSMEYGVRTRTLLRFRLGEDSMSVAKD